MRGYVIMDNTICQGNIVAGWLTIPRTDTTPDIEVPEIYRSPKAAALSILEDRIEWLESRKGNVEALDDDAEDLLDDCNGEAGDDQDFWIEAVEIDGEGADAVVMFCETEVQRTLRELSANAGRADGQRIQWRASGADFADNPEVPG